jgi:hypothetical protein
MKSEVELRLKTLFQRHPILVAGGVPARELDKLERYCGFALPDDYKHFVIDYGGAIVGPYPIYGLRRAHPMGNNDGSAIEVTERYRSQKTPGIENWLIISMDLSGSPIGLLDTGEIWLADCEWNTVEKISPDFETFLREVCLRKS